MVDMAVHQILPAAMRYGNNLCKAVANKMSMGLPCTAETDLAKIISENTDALYADIQVLKDALSSVPRNPEAASFHYQDQVIPAMEKLRFHADILEEHTAKSYWPYPTYSDLLFY